MKLRTGELQYKCSIRSCLDSINSTFHRSLWEKSVWWNVNITQAKLFVFLQSNKPVLWRQLKQYQTGYLIMINYQTFALTRSNSFIFLFLQWHDLYHPNPIEHKRYYFQTSISSSTSSRQIENMNISHIVEHRCWKLTFLRMGLKDKFLTCDNPMNRINVGLYQRYMEGYQDIPCILNNEKMLDDN